MKTKEKPLSYNYLTEFNTHDDSLDIIFVKKLRGRTIIGICEDELHKPQEIVLDICIGVPKTKASISDNINHTIDYDKVRKNILEIMNNHNFKLLESFAEEIANLLLNNFGAYWVKLDVAKPRKYNDVDSVGISIQRERNSQKQSTSFHKTQYILREIGAGHVPRK